MARDDTFDDDQVRAALAGRRTWPAALQRHPLPRAVRADERDLPEALAAAVVNVLYGFLHGALAENPYRVGRTLRFQREGCWWAPGTVPAHSLARSISSAASGQPENQAR